MASMGGTCTFVWLAFYYSRLLVGQGSTHGGLLKWTMKWFCLALFYHFFHKSLSLPLRLQQNSNALPALLTSNKARSIFNLHLCRGACCKHLFSCHSTRGSSLIASDRGMTGSALWESRWCNLLRFSEVFYILVAIPVSGGLRDGWKTGCKVSGLL